MDRRLKHEAIVSWEIFGTREESEYLLGSLW